MEIIFIITLGVIAFWLFAESNKLNPAVRIISGIGCIILVAFSTRIVTRIIPNYESHAHKSDIRLMGKLMTEGNTQQVQQAIQLYNRIAATGSTYSASMQIWQTLNQAQPRTNQ